MTWLEDHYGLTMEEAVALIEGMRQANLIVNVKNPEYLSFHAFSTLIGAPQLYDKLSSDSMSLSWASP